MKKIVVVLDGLALAKKTMNFAIKLAVKEQSLLLGLFPESFLYHQFDITQMLGKNGMSVVKLRHAVRKEHDRREQSRFAFSKACEKAGISYAISVSEGITLDEVIHESVFADMIIVSKQEHFSKMETKIPTNFCRQLLVGARCPVFLADDPTVEIQRLVMLYDGKPESVHAFRSFFLLFPSMSGIPAEIVHVSDRNDTSEIPDVGLLKGWMDCHSQHVIFTILTGGEKSTATDYIRKKGPGTLVISGAYGRGSLSRWIVPSMAEGIISECPCSLFTMHTLQ